MDDNSSETISISAVAEQLGISRASAYRACKRGDIPVLRIGRRLVIPRAAYEEMLRTAEQPGRTASGGA